MRTNLFPLLLLLGCCSIIVVASSSSATNTQQNGGSAFSLIFGPSSAVRNVDGPNSLRDLMGPHKAAYMLIYAPWSDRCKRAAKVFNKFAHEMQGLVKVGALDGTHPSNTRVIKTLFNVREEDGFPAVRFWTMGDKNHHEARFPRPYSGRIVLDKLVEHAFRVAIDGDTILRRIVHDKLASKAAAAGVAANESIYKRIALLFTQDTSPVPAAFSVAASFVGWREMREVVVVPTSLSSGDTSTTTQQKEQQNQTQEKDDDNDDENADAEEEEDEDEDEEDDNDDNAVKKKAMLPISFGIVRVPFGGDNNNNNNNNNNDEWSSSSLDLAHELLAGHDSVNFPCLAVFELQRTHDDVGGGATSSLLSSTPISKLLHIVSTAPSSKKSTATTTTSPDDIVKFLLPFMHPPPMIPNMNDEALQQQLQNTNQAGNTNDNIKEKNKRKVIFTPVRECASLHECMSKHADEPFVVRQTPEFAHTSEELGTKLYLQSRSKLAAAGVTNDFERFEVSTLMKKFLNDTLDIAVFDSPIPALFPLPGVFDEFVVEEEKQGAGGWEEQAKRLSPAFMYANAYTGLHIDVVEKGGGWMHIWRGKKVWHFIHPKHYNLFVGDDSVLLDDIQPDELQQRLDLLSSAEKDDHDQEEEEEDVEIEYAVVEANDTICFPPGFMHRVWTLDKSFGFAGYLTLKGGVGVQKEALAIMGAHEKKITSRRQKKRKK